MFHGYLPAILSGLGVTLASPRCRSLVACVFGLLGALAKLSAFTRWRAGWPRSTPR